MTSTAQPVPARRPPVFLSVGASSGAAVWLGA